MHKELPGECDQNLPPSTAADPHLRPASLPANATTTTASQGNTINSEIKKRKLQKRLPLPQHTTKEQGNKTSHSRSKTGPLLHLNAKLIRPNIASCARFYQARILTQSLSPLSNISKGLMSAFFTSLVQMSCQTITKLLKRPMEVPATCSKALTNVGV